MFHKWQDFQCGSEFWLKISLVCPVCSHVKKARIPNEAIWRCWGAVSSKITHFTSIIYNSCHSGTFNTEFVRCLHMYKSVLYHIKRLLRWIYNLGHSRNLKLIDFCNIPQCQCRIADECSLCLTLSGYCLCGCLYLSGPR